MPFQLTDLVFMSLALRDACVGIIELAHPETKPTLKEDYRKAFQSVGATSNLLTLDELTRQMDTWAYLFKVKAHACVCFPPSLCPFPSLSVVLSVLLPAPHPAPLE